MPDEKPGQSDRPRIPIHDNFRPATAPTEQKNYTPRPSEQGNVRPETGQSKTDNPPRPAK